MAIFPRKGTRFRKTRFWCHSPPLLSWRRRKKKDSSKWLLLEQFQEMVLMILLRPIPIKCGYAGESAFLLNSMCVGNNLDLPGRRLSWVCFPRRSRILRFHYVKESDHTLQLKSGLSGRETGNSALLVEEYEHWVYS